MLCFKFNQRITQNKSNINIWFSHSTISSLRGKCGENPKIKNRLTCHNQQIKRFYWYPEPGSNRHNIAVIGV